jgi:RNA:NAD 2'-phosphotransferase (TPT1/KptA family)
VFFTFRSYGTWLHGDERSSVDRHHNVYGSPRITHNPNWKNYNETLLKRPPLTLNADQRKSVEKAIHETCDKRRWELFAFNIRTNHVHVVADIRAKDPKLALGALKANAPRQMREDRVWDHEDTP